MIIFVIITIRRYCIGMIMTFIIVVRVLFMRLEFFVKFWAFITHSRVSLAETIGQVLTKTRREMAEISLALYSILQFPSTTPLSSTSRRRLEWFQCRCWFVRLLTSPPKPDCNRIPVSPFRSLQSRLPSTQHGQNGFD